MTQILWHITYRVSRFIFYAPFCDTTYTKLASRSFSLCRSAYRSGGVHPIYRRACIFRTGNRLAVTSLAVSLSSVSTISTCFCTIRGGFAFVGGRGKASPQGLKAQGRHQPLISDTGTPSIFKCPASNVNFPILAGGWSIIKTRLSRASIAALNP